MAKFLPCDAVEWHGNASLIAAMTSCIGGVQCRVQRSARGIVKCPRMALRARYTAIVARDVFAFRCTSRLFWRFPRRDVLKRVGRNRTHPDFSAFLVDGVRFRVR